MMTIMVGPLRKLITGLFCRDENYAKCQKKKKKVIENKLSKSLIVLAEN